MTIEKALAMAGHTTWASHSREWVDDALSVLASEVIRLRVLAAPPAAGGEQLDEARRMGFYAGFAYRANGHTDHVYGANVYCGGAFAPRREEP